MRIVYCTDTICYPGGIQIVTITKANALAKIDGNEVWIVVTDNKKNVITTVSDNVHVIDLDINYYEDDWKGLFYQIRGLLIKGRLHKKRIQSFLNSIAPDIVISTGTSEKYFLPSLRVCSSPRYIREIHFEKYYRRRAATSKLSKIYAQISEWYDYCWKIKKYDKIVVLTHEDQETNWNGWEKVVVIPNPITTQHNYQSTTENKIAISAGRLVPQKNFSSLIRIWSLVAEKYPDWTLQIWGSGWQEALLKKMIVSLNLQERIKIMGYTNELEKEMQQASLFIMTSEYEGFPLVMIEAMSVGLPLISYAFPTGPKDIITDGEDGFLIPVGNEGLFAEKICTLIGNFKNREILGKNASLKSNIFSIDSILEKWMCVFRELLKN